MERKIFNDERVYKIVNQIKNQFNKRINTGIILGSGWNAVCNSIQEKTTIPYNSLSGMPKCGVQGHSGNFVLGSIGDKNIIAAQGRFHLYEGKVFDDILLPLKIMYTLGIDTLILTNAAGGLNDCYNRGDLMVFNDHINFTFKNPLAGIIPTDDYPIFVDMTNVYDQALRANILSECNRLNIKAHVGVYMQLLGPSYETPAEIQAFKKLGADAVGMSTVVEAIFARYLHLKVAAISAITNLGAGIEKNNLDHNDVLAQACKNENLYANLLKSIIKY